MFRYADGPCPNFRKGAVFFAANTPQNIPFCTKDSGKAQTCSHIPIPYKSIDIQSDNKYNNK